MRTDAADRSTSLAVLIGSASYEDPSYLQVVAAANSARHMARMLTNPALGNWPIERVVTIIDPQSARDVAKRLRSLVSQLEGELLLYFAGHGVLNEDLDLCLVLKDTDPDNLDYTGLTWPQVRKLLLASPARVKAVILDCCYSGQAITALSGTDSPLADGTAVRGVYTLTAADGTADVVPAAQQSESCTSFTAQLLELVHAGIPSEREQLTFQTLYPHLKRRLAERGLPEPNQRGIDTADAFVLALNVQAQAGASPRPDGWPDPAQIDTAKDYVQALRHLRMILGASQAEVSERSNGELSIGRISRLLRAPSLPRPWATVSLYLKACGAPADEEARWHNAWQRLAAQTPARVARVAEPQLEPEPATRRSWWRRR
ncbi:caspase, EACC1-associated type [Kitasatospora kifunensis]|uniref:Peptidase C14 caspase domain-containing protein n=1 Tax=Kitasatospora kifunensis TaxID=58351 RepID=A0A7W7VU07_KITKI|nr:caspase family protein [Kitasatospora kifunensis]MBB4921960.1 hypothetical protein [Kitasatospora kifunensis]